MGTARCWFCERRSADHRCARHCELRRVTQLRGGDPISTTTRIPVPRCRACRRAHGRELLVSVAFFLAFGLAGMAASAVFLVDVLPRALCWLVLWLAVGAGAICGNLGALVSMLFQPLVRGDRRPEDHPDVHPTVAAAIDQGWRLTGRRRAALPRARARFVTRDR